MPNTVDRRVVEMRFDNKDFSNNVQDTMTVLDKLKEKLSFKNAGKGLADSGMSSAIEDVKSRFSALEIIGTTALVNLTNSAVNFGKQMTKAFTIDQVKAGFSEYELKMGSIQTIMASTGADIQEVNKYLNELNTYSDKTIYSFSDMTNSIGKFTNAGVNLDTAVKAIQGISNEAAVSGANAQEASRAMYNFAQALSAGYVKLIDWKSIENANMATKEFKQQLIDTAVEMGNLEKQSDGTYKVLTQGANGAFKENITATKNFNDSLSAAWMSTDVLTTTLSRYADETTDIGKKAFAAAQDVKTFSQLIDTVKEAIGSGWAQTFELIFGNLEEAKVLWTAVNNVISDFVSRSADARNGVLQIWKASNGRAALIDGFKQLYLAVSSFIDPIKDAFNDVFSPIRGEQLTALSFRFRDFAKSLMISGETAAKIKNIFTVIFSVLKTGINIVKSVAKIFGSFIKVLLPIGGSALSLMDNISQAMMKLADGVSTLSDKLKELTKGLLGKAMSGLGKLFALIGDGISHINLSALGGLLAGGGIMAVGMKMVKFIDTLSEKFENLFGGGDGEKKGGLFDKVKESFDSLSKTLNEFQTSLKVGQLITIAVAIGILAASCATLADIPAKKLATAVAAIGGLFTELGVASHLMKGASTSGMIALSVAILLLASAVKKLSEVENMGKGLLGVGALLAELTAFCAIFDRNKIQPKSLVKTGAGLILMAVAINLLAKPVKELGAMDTGSLIKGLSALGVMLGEFTAVAFAFGKINTKGLIKAGAAMVIMAAAMRILAKPLIQLGGMDVKSLAKGLGAMGIALAELAGFSKIMSMIAASTGNIMKVSAALLVMSIGIKIMAGAIAQMGMDSSAGQGLSVMFGSLVILAGAMALMQKSLAGAAAMIVVAGALAILAPAIALLSSLNFTGVLTGLFALAGTLAIFGVSAALLGPVIPIMFALGGAMALLGVGALSLGAGMTILAVAFSTGTGAIVSGVKALAEALPIVAEGVGNAILTMIDTIAKGAPLIKDAFINILDTLLAAGTEVLPKLITFGMDIIIALLQGIRSRIVEITTIAIEIVELFLGALAEKAPDLANAGLNFIVSFINGTANAIATNGPALVRALENLVLSIIEVVVGAIPVFGKQGAKAIADYRKGLDSGSGAAVKSVEKTKKGIEKNLEIDPKIGRTTKTSMDEYSKAVDKGGKEASKKAKTASEDVDKNLMIPSQFSNGYNSVSGIINGINAMLPSLRSKANEVSSIVDEIYKERNKISSPSKVMLQNGRYMMQGLINGLDLYVPTLKKKTENIATTLIGSTNSAISSMNDFATPNLSGTISRTSEVNLRMAGVERENQKLYTGINALTKQLDSMTNTMNSRSLNNYITVDGASDPSAFADELIRSFRLNARTV